MRNRLPNGGRRSGTRQPRRSRFSREVRVLYEDDAVIVLDKPPGLLAVPAPGSNAPSAWSLLASEFEPRRRRVFVVHRIDRFVSGILLFAKTHNDRDSLIREFLAHRPVREYLAVVRGRLSSEEGTLVHHFRRQGMFQKPARERDPKAARAELHYEVEQPLRGATLVRVRLGTGLQNQIRVQFAEIGHPVIGDRKYAPAEAEEAHIDRVALHAAHLEFTHPRSGKRVRIDCEPPPDFRSLLQALRLPNRTQ